MSRDDLKPRCVLCGEGFETVGYLTDSCSNRPSVWKYRAYHRCNYLQAEEIRTERFNSEAEAFAAIPERFLMKEGE